MAQQDDKSENKVDKHIPKWLEKSIAILIILNIIAAGLFTHKEIKQQYGHALLLFSDISSVIFILEMLYRIIVAKRDFWRGENKKWNLFDLVITIVSSASLFVANHTVIALRILRQLRVFRVISEFDSLRDILDGLMGAVSKLAWASVFFFVIYFIYAIIGVDYFGDVYPQWFENMGVAMFTLFQVMTFEGWTIITEEVMKTYPWAWAYFISFILIVSYILLNLIVGVIVSSLREKVDKQDEKEDIEQIKKELAEIKKLLKSKKKQ